jgi:hypothetical protein
MDMATLQNRLTAMRASDGELETRLSDLDVKLGAWLAVVEAGHAALVELARQIVPSAVPHAARVPLAQPAAPGDLRAPPGPPPSDADNDEALLRTLDPETARAIRVRRRLSRGNRSVQELLEEHRAAQARQQAEQEGKSAARRSWWRRKDD